MLITVLLITGIAFITVHLGKSPDVKITASSSDTSGDTSSTADVPAIITDYETASSSKILPESFRALSIVPEADFITGDFETTATAIKELIDEGNRDRFNAVNLLINKEKVILADSEFGDSRCDGILGYVHEITHRNGMTLALTVDISDLAPDFARNSTAVDRVCKFISSDAIVNNCDMLIISGYGTDDIGVPAAKIDEMMKTIYGEVAAKSEKLPVGVDCGEYLYSSDDSGAITLKNTFHSDVKKWSEENYCDFLLVSNYCSTDIDSSFKSRLNYWKTAAANSKIYYRLSYTMAMEGVVGFEKTDQMVRQLMALEEAGINDFIFDSAKAYYDDMSERRESVKKYISGQINKDFITTELSVTSPESKRITVYEDTIPFKGASDPQFALYLNGEVLERNELGYFSLDIKLSKGKNTFTLEHKGVSTTYTVTYAKTVIKSFSPSNAPQELAGGTTVIANVEALAGSKVTAEFNGEKIEMTENKVIDVATDEVSEYSNYSAKFVMPISYVKDQTLGKITFTAVSDFGTENKSSGNITVLKSDKSDDPTQKLPEGGNYIDVGNVYVAEVVTYQAETFNANDDGDWSRPTNNYLPKGTVDYCTPTATVLAASNTEMRTLRFGRMMYTTHDGFQNIKVYEGNLPNTNKITVQDTSFVDKYTQITFGTEWKAPFTLDLLDQKYNCEGGQSDRDYRISSATYDHVDITFCYANEVEGTVTISPDDPVFSSAEWIKNTSDHTLRLHLKRTGEFYGWTADYNSSGMLVFKFLHPAAITKADNIYGYSLKGITVAIDVGHGGSDEGAHGYLKDYPEAYLNLMLANKLKAELESMGATVYMNRTSDKTLTRVERITSLKAANPDLCISIHRNAVSNTAPRGYSAYHFNGFSSNAAKAIFNATMESGPYEVSKWTGLKWHNYYVLRGVTDCPFVLTENGFVSNSDEYQQLLDDAFNNKAAIALAQGVVDYFRSIQFS